MGDALTDLVVWLRQQLDTDEATARATKQPHVYWYTDGHSDEVYPFLDAFNADFVLRQVQAHRAILDEYEHRLALKAENGEKFVALTKSSNLDQQEFTNVKTHGWELSGRVAALKFAVDTLVSIYSDRDGYNPEWSA